MSALASDPLPEKLIPPLMSQIFPYDIALLLWMDIFCLYMDILMCMIHMHEYKPHMYLKYPCTCLFVGIKNDG